jgi:hypothetical protein
MSTALGNIIGIEEGLEQVQGWEEDLEESSVLADL